MFIHYLVLVASQTHNISVSFRMTVRKCCHAIFFKRNSHVNTIIKNEEESIAIYYLLFCKNVFVECQFHLLVLNNRIPTFMLFVYIIFFVLVE